MRRMRDIGADRADRGCVACSSRYFRPTCGSRAAPLGEGVPEVSVVRLEGLLKQNLGESDWRAVAEKLLEAMVAANQTADAFKLLADPRLRQSPSANFGGRNCSPVPIAKQKRWRSIDKLQADRNSSPGSDAPFGSRGNAPRVGSN